MARPTKNDIDSGIQNWHQKIDDNDEVLFNGPLPIHVHTGDETNLAATFPVASFDRCLVVVNHSTLGWTLYASDGTTWQRLVKFAAIAVTALTDSSGGTANNTIQALTNPADAPATADALRDDLVANLIPELRNNFADLAAKVNEIRTALVNHGLLS